jgi:ABC-2 type transport system ATP-binding protein
VNVGSRHPAALSRLAFEVEFDQHGGLVPHYPPVMAGLNGDHLRSGELQCAAVRVLNVDLAAGEKPDVRVLAQIGAHNRFHVSGPAESGRINDALDAAAAGTRDVKLDAANFAVVGFFHGCEEWIGGTHVGFPSIESVAPRAGDRRPEPVRGRTKGPAQAAGLPHRLTHYTGRMPEPGARIALRVSHLRKAYKDVVAVDDIELDVRAGECFGLLGPNGAGKTTTIEICEGLTAADSGEVEVLGLRWNSDAARLRQRLGIQLQETQLSEKLTVSETVRLFRSFFRQGPAPSQVIGLVQLEEKRNSRVGALSGGQKQRLALACALVGDPDFLFLDEPTTGLDPQARRQLWELIEQFKLAGRTILLTTHYMDEAERLCDRVAIMDHGKVIALGTPRELIASIGAEHVVEFSAGGAGRAVETSAMRGIEGVRDVHSENGSVLMHVTELHRAVPALLDELTRQGVPLTELRTHSASLEDVFVALTGRHLRDE